MKKIIYYAVALISFGQQVQAGFECFDKANQQLVVSTVQEKKPQVLEQLPADLIVHLEGENKVIPLMVEGVAVLAGSKYDYSNGESTLLTITQTSYLKTFPPHCKEGSRVTCDYTVVMEYMGFFNFAGESHDLVCSPH